MVRLLGTVTRVAVLAIADRQSVSGYGGEIWRRTFCQPSGCFPNSLQNRVYWPGLRQDVRSYLASCTVWLARKSPCPQRAPMGHVDVGHRWDRVALSEMGDFMEADLLLELSGKTWVAATLLEGLTADLSPAGSDIDLIVASR